MLGLSTVLLLNALIDKLRRIIEPPPKPLKTKAGYLYTRSSNAVRDTTLPGKYLAMMLSNV
jgi:hypothetical protein